MSQKPFHVTPVYDLLLRGSPTMPIGLYHLHLATAAQLCRLHYRDGTLTTVKARLKTLVDQGFILVDSVPTRLFRSPYYYTMGLKGMRYLAQAGLDVEPSFRADKEGNKHWLFIDHTLELNDILIAAALIKRVHPNVYLDNFIHERELKRRPYRAVWRDSKLTLVPDAFLDFRVRLPDGRVERRPRLLEHDRGTEQQQHFRRRVRAYILLLKEERVPVAFTTFEGDRRLKQMREWTRQELAATNEPPDVGLNFLFASLQQPLNPRCFLEPRWLTPDERQPPKSLLNA